MKYGKEYGEEHRDDKMKGKRISKSKSRSRSRSLSQSTYDEDNVKYGKRTVSKSSRSHLCSSSERTCYRPASRGRDPKANATMEK